MWVLVPSEIKESAISEIFQSKIKLGRLLNALVGSASFICIILDIFKNHINSRS